MQRVSCALRYRLCGERGKAGLCPWSPRTTYVRGRRGYVACRQRNFLHERRQTQKLPQRARMPASPHKTEQNNYPVAPRISKNLRRGRAPKQDMPRLAPCIRKNIPPNAGGLFFVARVTQKELPPTPRLGKRKRSSERCGNERPVSNEKAAQCRLRRKQNKHTYGGEPPSNVKEQKKERAKSPLVCTKHATVVIFLRQGALHAPRRRRR